MSPRAAANRATLPAAATTPAEGPITLTLPLPPNMANGRKHWRAKNRERQSYFGACDLALVTRMVPEPPAKPMTRATVEAFFRVWSLMDDDNAVSRAKWPLDWLVTRGYLAGDSRKHITWAGMPEQYVDRKTNGSVTFTLTPIPVEAAG